MSESLTTFWVEFAAKRGVRVYVCVHDMYVYIYITLHQICPLDIPNKIHVSRYTKCMCVCLQVCRHLEENVKSSLRSAGASPNRRTHTHTRTAGQDSSPPEASRRRQTYGEERANENLLVDVDCLVRLYFGGVCVSFSLCVYSICSTLTRLNWSNQSLLLVCMGGGGWRQLEYRISYKCFSLKVSASGCVCGVCVDASPDTLVVWVLRCLSLCCHDIW